MWADGGVYDVSNLTSLINSIWILKSRWYDLAIVCWWWNIWRFRDMQHLNLSRVESDCLWIMATSMNASVLASSFRLHWIDSKAYVSPWYTIPEHSSIFSAKEAWLYLKQWGVVVCWWWTWRPYATTDSAGVVRWLELNCDIVVKCSTVDGIYNKDPREHADAIKYDTLTHEQAVKEWLKVMDQAALWLARQENIDICVCHMDSIQSIWTDTWTWTVISSASC